MPLDWSLKRETTCKYFNMLGTVQALLTYGLRSYFLWYG